MWPFKRTRPTLALNAHLTLARSPSSVKAKQPILPLATFQLPITRFPSTANLFQSIKLRNKPGSNRQDPCSGYRFKLVKLPPKNFEYEVHLNSRFLPAEVMVYNGEAHLIREREGMEDLLRNQVEVEPFTIKS